MMHAKELFAGSCVGLRMAYRDGDALLRERLATLESELANVKARRENEKTLRAREEELRGEVARMRIDLSERARKLPMLARVTVASPCSASWDAMIGDDKTRFCTSCSKDVHNLSAMSEDEAEALLNAKAAGGMCVRYFQRADGTVMTQDCPVGVQKKRFRRVASLAVGAAAAAGGALFWAAPRPVLGETRMAMNEVAGTPSISETAAHPAIAGGIRMRSAEEMQAQRLSATRGQNR